MYVAFGMNGWLAIPKGQRVLPPDVPSGRPARKMSAAAKKNRTEPGRCGNSAPALILQVIDHLLGLP